MDTAPALDPVAARMERGLAIAQRMRITRKAPGVYVVPSSKPTGAGNPGFYTVVTTKGAERCSCPDFELRGAVMRCKHSWAVEYSRRSETMADGSERVTETLRVTYSQDWSAYNAAQTHEREHAVSLLRSLCDGLSEEPQTGKGERRLPIGDRVFAVIMKVWDGDSARRSDTNMREYAARGLMEWAPSYNSVLRYMEDPALTPILRSLLRESAAPLASVEGSFAIDSTGFTTCTYRRWFDEKYGKEHSEHKWLKAHVSVGTRTNVITDAVVTDESGADSPQLPALLEGTAQHFTPREVSADKAYLGYDNLSAIANAGAMPYIPFKVNSVAVSRTKDTISKAERALWKKLFGFFTFQREEFCRHYNQRSNVETTFSAVKRKFGPSLRSKTFTAQVNECYAKLLCSNLSVLVHEMYELGIVPMFWQDETPDDDLPPPEPASRVLKLIHGNGG